MSVNSTAPSSTAPSSTAPSSTAPSSTAPSSTAPSSTAPSSTAPSSTAPSDKENSSNKIPVSNKAVVEKDMSEYFMVILCQSDVARNIVLRTYNEIKGTDDEKYIPHDKELVDKLRNLAMRVPENHPIRSKIIFRYIHNVYSKSWGIKITKECEDTVFNRPSKKMMDKYSLTELPKCYRWKI